MTERFGTVSRQDAGWMRVPLSLAIFLFAAFVWLQTGAAHAQALEAYRLGPGDKVKVTVFGHPQESGEFEIDGSGNLSYPLLGSVPAKSRTIAELQQTITSELDKNYIVDPKVTIEVLNYRPFYIYGEVQRAGQYEYVAGLTVRRAIAIAGGFTRRARHEPVTLIREADSGVTKAKSDLDKPVLPGDIIEVSRRFF